MPPKTKVTKKDIISAAIEIVRESGSETLNARAIAARLNCSTQPIFSNFDSMEILKQETVSGAMELFHKYLADCMSSLQYPPYKASGIAYIRFAKEEKQLFRLLFMRDRSKENSSVENETSDELIEMIAAQSGMSIEDAKLFHMEMWIFVHGTASMFATTYLELDEELISSMLTDIYSGLLHRFKNKGEA
ncbi:MAG: TetR/AcrR family transcriptional regulator [Oscillospiraceae bacterium]